MNMTFSIIVPFLNEERYIERCVESLVNQDFDKGRYEIIFVDNGSTDASRGIVKKYKDIILADEKKPSAYYARNKGLATARGEIVAFTDADCEVSRDWLTQIYRGMEETGASIALGSRYFPPDSPRLLKMIEDYEHAKIEYLITNSLKNYYFGYAGNMAIRSEIFKRIGLFAELGIGADTEYVHRCISKIPDAKIVYLPEMKITYLEVTGFGNWLKKQYIYGMYRKSVKRVNEPNQKKYRLEQAMFYCARKYHYSIIKTLFLFFAAKVSSLSYQLGNVHGHIIFFITRLIKKRAYCKSNDKL